MVAPAQTLPEEDGELVSPRAKHGFSPIWSGILILLAIALGWLVLIREDVADSVISGQLAKLDLPAQYDVESIGPHAQVLTNIVIGDPARPDLTIERAEITLEPRWGLPAIGRITLVRPRLFGQFVDGTLSFGALDPLLFPQDAPEEPFEFPDLELVLDDGRALLESDFGPIGFKAQGRGNLQSGFSAIVAANAPGLDGFGCRGEAVTLYGKVTIRAERPGFAGPLRLANVNCAQSGLRARDVALHLESQLDRTFDGVEAQWDLASGPIAADRARLAAMEGEGAFTWRDDALNARYNVSGQSAVTAQLSLAALGAEGTIRARGLGGESSRIELESDITGGGLQLGAGFENGLDDLQSSARDTMLGPMLAQIKSALKRESRGSQLAANLTMRQTGDDLNVVMPQARLRGGSGATLLAVSRFEMGRTGDSSPRFSGNFNVAGAGLPRISGRVERQTPRETLLRLTMADYAVKGGRLGLPEMLINQRADASVTFAGSVEASGPLPGGRIDDLRLPVSGTWSSAGGLSLWRNCTDVQFANLQFANLALDRRAVRLCPASGRAIVENDARGLRIAAGVPALDLTGKLGATPISLATGAVGFAYPGILTTQALDVTLGEAETSVNFKLASLTATLGQALGGRFEDTQFMLSNVPIDVLGASGEWTYGDGVLNLANGVFRLEDREQVDRFQPLVVQGASVRLADNLITGHAALREPSSDRVIALANILHDLDTGAGRVDLGVDGLVFDDRLQPDMVTHLALGVIANAHGMISGDGQIFWDENSVDSMGSFTVHDLDFAAAFGPVQGLRGTIEFTDLINMVTAPNQRFAMESINPGIEANAGTLDYELREGLELIVHRGRWPFIGGTLTLLPVATRLGVPETRRYTIQIEGADAARFIERMELANLTATGTFDGTLPLVFDEQGGHIENGLLASRAPGGNLSYVGGLTYEDMGAITNFAFNALRSLDYRTMEVELNGSLTGELVTKVRFDGVKQGSTAKRNIITRQLAKLPIRFNVNIRAPFYKLLTSVQAMYDPAYIRDPREVGLIDNGGNIFPAPTGAPRPVPDEQSAEPAVQTPESENLP